MKHIILSLFFALVILSVSAQNNSVKIISMETDSVINGTTYIVYADGATHDVKKEFKAVMNIQDSMLVAIKRQEISIIPGTFDYFCWYLCYPPEAAGTKPVWEAEDSLWMYRGDTISSFSVYLQPEMKLGQATYRYVFYPGDNPSDSSYFDVMFDVVTVGIETADEGQISVYPNPFNESLIIDIPEEINSGKLSFQLYDMTGRLVLSGDLKKGINRIAKADIIPSGNFIFRINDGNKSILDKHIIRK